MIKAAEITPKFIARDCNQNKPVKLNALIELEKTWPNKKRS